MSYKLIAASVLILCLAACGDQPQINVRLGWTVNANSAGPIVADALGFYASAGLDVEINPGGLNSPALNSVVGGVDDIGFSNGIDPVLKAQAAGADLRILAAFHQQSYHGFFVRQGMGLASPADWVGRRVGVKYASPTYILYEAMLAREGIERSSIKEFPLGHDPLLFLQGEIDVYPGATTNEGIFFEMEGVPVEEVLPGEFGIETYGTVCFVTEKFYAQNRDLLTSFVEATVEGWIWASKPENEEQVLEYLLQRDPKLNREKERLALRRTLKFVLVEDASIGEISSSKVEEIVNYLLRAEAIELDPQYTVTAAGIVER